MKVELQKELHSRYKKLLNHSRYRDLPRHLNKTIIQYGFECGDGWFNVVNDFLSAIEKVCQNHDSKPLILRISVKNGKLNLSYLYTDITELDDRIDEIATFYINRSKTTCENCGTFAEITEIRDSKKSLCEDCLRLFKHPSYKTDNVVFN